MNRFTGKVVLVTGASRGIGAATAMAFAQEGAKIAVNYRADLAGAEQTKAAIETAGGVAMLTPGDIAVTAEIERMVAAIEAQLGAIDVLINNAAVANRSNFLDLTLDELDLLWLTNVRGVFHLSQRVAKGMTERGAGVIIHLSSILARLAVPSRTAYCTTKAAIEGMTRAMAVDLAPFGVRVNAVAPGLVSTEMLLSGMPDPDLQATIQSYIPGGRFGYPAEVASVILFLCSDDAAYINGSLIPVDAGLSGREAGPPR